jgi:hypothetical protein
MESPDKKEEKYVFKEKDLKFFSAAKIFKLLGFIFLSLFAVFGLLAFLNLTVAPDLGIIDLAKDRTSEWRRAKSTDMGHEAIAFELMLDAYAEKGGDISHALDTLTDEFTAANWAELLEYDVDYFQKHPELGDSVKMHGMLHITKTLYTSGHYDLFKESYKVLVGEFASDRDMLSIYVGLLSLKSKFAYDDEEEREELARLYDLELRRHLSLSAKEIIGAMESSSLLAGDVRKFFSNLNEGLSLGLANRDDNFRQRVKADIEGILNAAGYLIDSNESVKEQADQLSALVATI